MFDAHTERAKNKMMKLFKCGAAFAGVGGGLGVSALMLKSSGSPGSPRWSLQDLQDMRELDHLQDLEDNRKIINEEFTRRRERRHDAYEEGKSPETKHIERMKRGRSQACQVAGKKLYPGSTFTFGGNSIFEVSGLFMKGKVLGLSVDGRFCRIQFINLTGEEGRVFKIPLGNLKNMRADTYNGR